MSDAHDGVILLIQIYGLSVSTDSTLGNDRRRRFRCRCHMGGRTVTTVVPGMDRSMLVETLFPYNAHSISALPQHRLNCHDA